MIIDEYLSFLRNGRTTERRTSKEVELYGRVAFIIRQGTDPYLSRLCRALEARYTDVREVNDRYFNHGGTMVSWTTFLEDWLNDRGV